MRRLAIFALTVAMLFALAVPAFAQDECGCEPSCSPWCGKVRTQGYWKNDGICENNSYGGWSFGSVSGDYKQIFANQAIAFKNNYAADSTYKCVPFSETYFRGPCGRYIPMSEMNAMVDDALANIDCMSRSDLLKLKDALDMINNGYNIYMCAPVNGV